MSWLESLRSWRSELAGLKRDRDKKRARIEALESAPPGRKCVLAAYLAEIDKFESYFNAQVADQAKRLFANDPWTQSGNHDQPTFALFTHQHGHTREADVRMLYGVLAPQLRAAVQSAIESADWFPDCGPPLEDRRREMDKLAADVAEIESKIAAFNSEANAAGVRLE